MCGGEFFEGAIEYGFGQALGLADFVEGVRLEPGDATGGVWVGGRGCGLRVGWDLVLEGFFGGVEGWRGEGGSVLDGDGGGGGFGFDDEPLGVRFEGEGFLEGAVVLFEAFEEGFLGEGGGADGFDLDAGAGDLGGDFELLIGAFEDGLLGGWVGWFERIFRCSGEGFDVLEDGIVAVRGSDHGEDLLVDGNGRLGGLAGVAAEDGVGADSAEGGGAEAAEGVRSGSKGGSVAEQAGGSEAARFVGGVAEEGTGAGSEV